MYFEFEENSGNYTSYARNRKVADVFREAGIIEKYGSGIQRITNAFISYGLQELVFEEFQNDFRGVRVYFYTEGHGVFFGSGLC